jgi:glycosyltransferase involved in cell wall biosynthesis
MIGRAISSVCQQTERDFELVVVDDGSTDETFEVARHFSLPIADRTKLIRLDTNLGIPGARNVCLTAMMSGTRTSWRPSGGGSRQPPKAFSLSPTI